MTEESLAFSGISKFSSTTSKISSALCKAQKAVHNPTADKENPFHKSKYASLSQVHDIVRGPCSENGIAVMFAAKTSLQENVLDAKTVEVELTLMCDSEFWTTSLKVKVKDVDPQSVASALTYCKRYLLLNAFGICAEDEDDDGNSHIPQNNKTNATAVYAKPVVQQIKPNKHVELVNQIVSAMQNVEDKEKRKVIFEEHTKQIPEARAEIMALVGQALKK